MCKFKHITQKISEPKQPTDDRTTWPKSPWVVLSTYKERKKSLGPISHSCANLQIRGVIQRAIVAGLASISQCALPRDQPTARMQLLLLVMAPVHSVLDQIRGLIECTADATGGWLSISEALLRAAGGCSCLSFDNSRT